MYLLDTNICIYIIKNRPEQVARMLKSHDPQTIKISSITVAELCYGIEKSQKREENRIALAKFLSPFEIINFDSDDAIRYGFIRSTLESRGIIIGPYDLQIASIALNRSYILVTNNEKEFSRVTDLKLENWTLTTAQE